MDLTGPEIFQGLRISCSMAAANSRQGWIMARAVARRAEQRFQLVAQKFVADKKRCSM